MLVKEEIRTRLRELGSDKFKSQILAGIYTNDSEQDTLFSSLLAGHHLLILGPTGCGKSVLAKRISLLLGEIEVTPGCPLNCPPQAPNCPWCLENRRQSLSKGKLLVAEERIKKIQGSEGVTPEDLTGDINAELALSQGIHSSTAFIPGKLLRANRGILLLDFIDRVPHRVLNVILTALQGDGITVGIFDEVIPLDILVVATGSKQALQSLPRDLLDCFDVITLDYISDRAGEKQLILDHLEQTGRKEKLSEPTLNQVVDVIAETRIHQDVERGVSTRGAIKFSQTLASFKQFKEGEEERWLRVAAYTSLSHRLSLPTEADSEGKREEIITEILDKVCGTKRGVEMLTLSKEQILDLIVEIVSQDDFRKPLKHGDFNLLLVRVRRFPESKLAQTVREIMMQLKELYPERFRSDNLTEEVLKNLEAVRKKDAEIARIAKELEAQALVEVLGLLERKEILTKSGTGWGLGMKGITFFLERLIPRVWQSIYTYGYGKHPTGRKLATGEGRIIGTRHYRFGDRYRDVSLKDTIREALRNRRQFVTRKDILVNIKDIRAKMDIVLVVDVSGTMQQLDKFWYAKESAIALSLAATQGGDRVGVVTFSNLAEVLADITFSPHEATKRVLELEIHRNAFTNIGFALATACGLFARHRGMRASRHIILVSDGDATAPHPSPQKYALRQAAKVARKGITISCVCINEESSDPELMRRIAKIGKGKIYFVGPEGLTDALLQERYNPASLTK